MYLGVVIMKEGAKADVVRTYHSGVTEWENKLIWKVEELELVQGRMIWEVGDEPRGRSRGFLDTKEGQNFGKKKVVTIR